MLIENESNWRTEDLVALVEAITGKEGFCLNPHIQGDTLLLFKTSRRRAKGWDHRTGGQMKPAVAWSTWGSKLYHNTLIIEIQSAKKLQMEVLDRLANINESGAQDMSQENVVKVASTISSAISHWRCRHRNQEWASEFTMRARPRITRSKLAAQRKLDKAEDDKRRFQDWISRELENYDKKIAKLRAEAEKL